MNRKARRKNKDEGKVKTYNLTNQQIQEMKKKVFNDALDTSFVLMFGIPVMVLRDENGFGKKRLEKFTDKVLELYQDFQEGRFELAEIYEIIEEETGLNIIKGFNKNN